MQTFKIGLIIFLSSSRMAAQAEITQNFIDSIVDQIHEIKEVDTIYFIDTLPLIGTGYHNGKYYYAVDAKTKDILWIKVWNRNRDETQTDLYYFQKNNLIKAIIGNYAGRNPTTAFYLWDNTLIKEIPTNTPLYWAAFNQIGHDALSCIKRSREIGK